MPRIVSIASGPGGRLCGLDEEGVVWWLVENVEVMRSDDGGSWRVEGPGTFRWALLPLEG